jgi:large subunit ribosomal protein L23
MGIFNRKTEDDNKAKAPQVSKVVNEKKEEKSMKDLYEENATVTVSKEGKTGEEKVQKKYGQAYRVLIKPLVTEKAANLGMHNKYVFAVSLKTNKIEIAKAIEEVYGIKPISVNIINSEGKTVRSGRTLGKRKDWKKAIVALPEGKTIKIYEGV